MLDKLLHQGDMTRFAEHCENWAPGAAETTQLHVLLVACAVDRSCRCCHVARPRISLAYRAGSMTIRVGWPPFQRDSLLVNSDSGPWPSNPTQRLL